MTLDITHMVQAVDQFLGDHGIWPTRLFVPIDHWTRAVEEAGATAIDPESPLPCLLAAIALRPGTSTAYLCDNNTAAPIVRPPIPDS